MSLDNKTKRAVGEFLETLFSHGPDIMGVDETIAGCEITDMDAYSTGTTPRYIRVRLQGGDAVAGGYLVDAFWRGGPSLGVGDSCTILHLRDGDRYEVIGAGGSTGVSTFTDVYQHVWVYDVSLGLLKPYTTINAALAYALLAAGDYILIPPGTHDENIILAAGVFVCEQIPGTVEIVATGGAAAVTVPAAGGDYYINIHTIKIERSLNSAAAANGLAAVVCNHVSGVATIFADLYCKNTYNTGDANSMGIRNVDAGDVVYRGKDAEWSIYVQSDGDDWGSYGVRSESTGSITGYGTIYTYSPNAGCWAYCIQNRAAAVIEWYGNLKLSCDYDGDMIQLRGGATVILNGDMDGYSNEHIRGVLARDGACTVHIRGKMVLDTLANFAIGIGNSYGGYVSSSVIVFEGIIDVTTAAGSARGVDISAGTCTGEIILLDVDVKVWGTGNSYGVNNEIINSTITVIDGRIVTTSTGGNAHDLRQTAGTLSVYAVQYDTTSIVGVVTLLDGDVRQGGDNTMSLAFAWMGV